MTDVEEAVHPPTAESLQIKQLKEQIQSLETVLKFSTRYATIKDNESVVSANIVDNFIDITSRAKLGDKSHNAQFSS